MNRESHKIGSTQAMNVERKYEFKNGQLHQEESTITTPASENEENFECIGCGDTFDTKEEARKHMEEVGVGNVNEVSPGEFRDIDEYTKELREAGYDTDYENVVESTTGFIAVLSVEEVEHAVFEREIGGQMVKQVKTPLSQI